MARSREFDTEAAVDAAMSAFRRRGYAGTSVQDLVDATGVGRGSLYGAFGNKEGLYLAVLDQYHKRYAEPLIGISETGVGFKDAIRDVLLGVIDATLEEGSQQACLVVAAASELAHRDVTVRKRLDRVVSSLEDALCACILQGQAAGEIPARHSAAAAAELLVTTIQGLRVMGAVRPDRARLTAIADTALACLE